MNLLKRIRNLWKLSEYRINERSDMFIKDFPTVKKRLATIIPEDKKNIFEEENDKTD